MAGGAVMAAVTVRGCVKAAQTSERCLYCGAAAAGAALTGGYAYFHSDYYYEAEAARRREREAGGSKRVAAVQWREQERYARHQREIEEEYRTRALESARLDTYEDPRNRHD